ncbi:MAG: 30S ribosomal protein S21 [Patescibacteria group bacterium]
MNVHVIVRPDEPFEKALKIFRWECKKSGILGQTDRQKFPKPSETRKEKARRHISQTNRIKHRQDKRSMP